MHDRRILRSGLVLALFLPGCAAPSVEPASPHEHIALRSGGRSIPGSSLWPLLAEAAGAAIVQEVILDEALRVRAEREGLTIDDRAIAHELELLGASISQAANTDKPGQVLDRVLAQRGIGPERLEALLLRNATLRAIVKPRVRVSAMDVELEQRLAISPRADIRYLLTRTLSDAAQARSRIEARGMNDGSTQAAFARECQERSIDPSAAAGGFVQGVSASDPSIPSPVRGAIETLAAGQMSEVLTVPDGFAIVRIEQKVAGGRAISTDQATAIARAKRERVAMDDLARELLQSADVQVLDPSLGWSWERGR